MLQLADQKRVACRKQGISELVQDGCDDAQAPLRIVVMTGNLWAHESRRCYFDDGGFVIVASGANDMPTAQ